MDHDAMHRHVNNLRKWKEEIQPILDFVKEMMPQTDEEKAEFAHIVERRRQAREERAAEQLGTDHSDGLRSGEELKSIGDSQPSAEVDPITGKPVVVPVPGADTSGTGSQGDAGAGGIDTAVGTEKATDGAAKPA